MVVQWDGLDVVDSFAGESREWEQDSAAGLDDQSEDFSSSSANIESSMPFKVESTTLPCMTFEFLELSSHGYPVHRSGRMGPSPSRTGQHLS